MFCGDRSFTLYERYAVTDNDAPYPEGIGTVIKVGRKYLYLRMDTSGKIVKSEPDDLISISDNAGHSPIMLYWHLQALGHPWRTLYDWVDDPEWRRTCKECRKNPPTHLNKALQIPRRGGSHA
jgi:hypothetical protein